jgi:hypothetical protein
MSKIQYLIPLVIISIIFTACEGPGAASNTTSKASQTTQQNTTSETIWTDFPSNWLDFPHKYATLAIRYPNNFKTKGGELIDSVNGKYNTLEIYHADSPVYIAGICAFRAPCATSGMQINISQTETPDEKNLHYINDVVLPYYAMLFNIRYKVKAEKRGSTGQDSAGNEKLSITDSDVREYLYSEYYYISGIDRKSYLIQVYERNFDGDSPAVINGILQYLFE